MTKQGYNYLDRSIQEMTGFFETRVENLETPAPPPAVRSSTKKKKKKIPRNGKLSPLRILTKISQMTRSLQAGRNSVSLMENAVILGTNVLHSMPWSRKPNEKSPNDLGKEARKRPNWEKAKESFQGKEER